MYKRQGLVDYDFPKLTAQGLRELYGQDAEPAQNPKELFQSNELQKEFDKNGFVKIPFLQHDDIDELLRIFWDCLLYTSRCV